MQKRRNSSVLLMELRLFLHSSFDLCVMQLWLVKTLMLRNIFSSLNLSAFS